MPEQTLGGWTTSLPASFDARDIIALYADRGPHEQLGQRGLLGPDAPVRHGNQAAVHQDADAGADLPRRAPDRTWPTIDPRAGCQRPRSQGVPAAVRRVVRPHCVHAAPPDPSPTLRGARKSRPVRVAARAAGDALGRASAVAPSRTSKNASPSRVVARSTGGGGWICPRSECDLKLVERVVRPGFQSSC